MPRARHGGYLEAFGPAWEPIADMRLSEVDMNEPKSQNHTPPCYGAYTAAAGTLADPGLKAALGEIVEIMLARIVDPKTGHLGLFFARTGPQDRTDFLTATHRGGVAPMRPPRVHQDPAPLAVHPRLKDRRRNARPRGRGCRWRRL